MEKTPYVIIHLILNTQTTLGKLSRTPECIKLKKRHSTHFSEKIS